MYNYMDYAIRRRKMHYIVLDLEWNQAEGRIGHEGGLPFEIVEIGAVKLNRRMQIVDRFEEVIRPRIYPHMHFMTTKIIQLDKKDLENGKDFPDVMERFLKWCGRKYRFCIWGTLDITELQRNMCYYGMDELTSKPLPFMDVQKLYSLAYEDGKTRRALEYAVDELNVKKDEPFHRAINDAYYTARVLEQIHKDHTEVESYLSFDLFMLPRNKKDEVNVRFKTYSKYISREFEDKTVAMQDKSVSATKCCVCGRPTKKVIKWFSVNGRHYYYVGICKRHGYVKAKIRMKKADDGNVFVVKTMKVTDQDGVDAIKEKQEKLRAQRAERRHRE